MDQNLNTSNTITTTENKNVSVSYNYNSFYGSPYQRYQFAGRNVVLLIPSTVSPIDINTVLLFLESIDDVWDFYYSMTNTLPTNFFHIGGKGTVAVVTDTCGSGCGYLGNTGIEILETSSPNDWWTKIHDSLKNEGVYRTFVYYEVGRNFYTSAISNKIGYPYGVTTGFAIFMRQKSVEYLNLPYDTYHAEWIERLPALLDLFVSNGDTFQSTIEKNTGTSNPWGFGASDLWASMMLYLCTNYGNFTFLQNFFTELSSLSNGVNNQDYLDNWYLASCRAAKTNLKDTFKNMWGVPLSSTVENTVNSEFKSVIYTTTRGNRPLNWKQGVKIT